MKNIIRKCLLTIVLAIVMIAVFMPAAALAEDGTESVTGHYDFVAAIANSEVTTINVTADFALTADVTIDRQVTIACLSDPGFTITTGGYSIIITGSEAVVTIGANLTVTGQEPIQVIDLGTADISGGTVAATGADSIGVYVGDHSTVTVSGGTIETTGDGSTGVYVEDGTADISNGMIEVAGAYSAGVWVEVGSVTISGGTIVAEGGDSAGVLVRPYSTANISGGTITATGTNSAGVYVVSGTADISGDPEISGDGYGVYVFSDGSANISGGTIVTEGEYGSGVYVEAGTANISGGAITAIGADSDGIYVCDGGTVIVSGDPEISGDANGVALSSGTADISGGTIVAEGEYGSGVSVQDGTANISGGTITATGAVSDGIYVYDGGTVIVSGDPEISGDAAGVHVWDGGTLTVSGAPEISGDTYGVYVNDSTADISGGTTTATGTNSYGIFVEYGGAVTVSDGAGISGDASGIYVFGGTVTVSISANLIISGGIYNVDDKVFLADLPIPVAMTAGETEAVELAGVDETINFEVDGATDEELGASITGNIVTLEPPDTTTPDTYTLALYASYEDSNYFYLTIPVTVAAETTAPVLSAPGASDATHTAANLNFTSGEAGTYYYLVYSAADAAPDKATVKAQGTAVAKGTGAALAAANTVSVSGLAPSTAYKAYVVVEDAAGNISDVATMNITTTATYIGGNDDDDDKSGGSGATSTPTVPEYKADVDTGNDSNSIMPVTIDKNSGIASVDVGKVNNLVSGGKTSVVTVPPIPDVDTYILNIPVPNLSTSDEQGALVFKTDIGTVTVPSNMLTGVEGINGSKVGISIGQGDKSNLIEDVRNTIGDRPLVQLTLSIDGKQIDWNNPSAPVAVSIPYTPTEAELANLESIVIWFVDGSGNAVPVPNGHYDAATGTVTFTTTHFSYYAVGYDKVSYTDVTNNAWYSDAVGFIAARGITAGTGNGKFSPGAKLTRGEFIVMLMRAYSIAADENPKDNFTDAGSAHYTGYLAAAKRLGISAGVGSNMFAPGREITRQEMFTLLYNALKIIGRLPEGTDGKTLSDFTDAGEIASWAKDSMVLLVKTGTVGGSGGKLLPTATTTRAEMAQVLYNLLAK